MTNRIGWVDDRAVNRRSVARIFNNHLPDGWECLPIAPLPSESDYVPWIQENEIAVLVLDEKLHEQVAQAGVHVDYEGHNVVDVVRAALPTFPIFVITAAEEDQELLRRFSDVEEIVGRKRFGEKGKDYVARLVRAGGRYLEQHSAKLARMMELATKSVEHGLDDDERNELDAIRATLQQPAPGHATADVDDLVRRCEELLGDLEAELGALP